MGEYLPVFLSPEGEMQVKRLYRNVLECWLAPYSELNIPTAFGNVHLIASGPEQAPPVFLLHAFFATAASWYANVGALAKDHRVYALDILGEANLSRPTRIIRSVGDHAAWFVEVLDALQIERVDLVGNSFGGFLAASFSLLLPQRVRRLVMIGPAATIHQIIPFYVNMFFPKALSIFFPKLPGHQHRLERSVEWIHAGLPYDPVWKDLFAGVLQHGGSTNQVFPKVYKPAELKNLSTPTLLVLGDREKIYPTENAFRAARLRFPYLRTELVPSAHHITALSQPEIVNRLLVEFLTPE